MQKNTVVKKPHVQMTEVTHEGGPAYKVGAEALLRRSVMSCFLWEKEFYENGTEISKRLAALVKEVRPTIVAQIAIEAREKMKLRHAPLFLVREMARHKTHRPFVAETLAKVIQRGDEMAEFMAMYWADGKQPIAHSVRTGLDQALRKFNEYELAKYDRDKGVKLRDVFRIIRPKPDGEVQKALWHRAVKGELVTPDTWEVSLSAKDGLSKKDKWTRLLTENKLGALAILRNLRNMEQEEVDSYAIRGAILKTKIDRVLPFRFIAAARHAPRYEADLEVRLLESVKDIRLAGNTAILVDISGSMDAKLSDKSDMMRIDAACGVAMIGREIFGTVDVYSFSDELKLVPARHGFALRDEVIRSQRHHGTELGKAVAEAAKHGYDRIIVISDEQAHDRVSYPAGLAKGYMINVASAKNGVGYGKWTHIDGFSEAVFQYIVAVETDKNKYE